MTIIKITVETSDDSGNLKTTHFHKDNTESIHWKKLGKSVGTVLSSNPPIL